MSDGKQVKSRRSCRVGCERLEGRMVLSGNVVVEWNQRLLEAIRRDATPPPLAARNMAIVQTAVFDAVNSIAPRYEAYLTRVSAPRWASMKAAVGAAAGTALAALYPGQAEVFDRALAETLEGVRNERARRWGVAVGTRTARAILEARADDGADARVIYDVRPEPGGWRPTPTGFASPALPQWPGVRPFALRTADQYGVADLPSLTSVEYATAWAEVKALGSATSVARTSDQTEIARFWADGAGTYTPPGHWNEIAQRVARREGLTVLRTARLFALLDIAVADAGIAAWDVKYETDCWRPITAIREADTDGNAATEADRDWAPLLETPPFPTYVSGHSTFSGAAAAVLTGEFGRHESFASRSIGLPGVTRRFRNFGAAAREAGISRIYGGIHFEFDNVEGLRMGEEIGEYVGREVLGRRGRE